MNKYSYVARSMDGKEIKGELTAENQAELFVALKRDNLFCVSYKEAPMEAPVKRSQKLKGKEIVVFCRKFGTMLYSGMTITAALEVMYESAEKPPLKKLYLSIYEDIQTGMSLSESLRAHGKTFSQFMISMVESGETAGTLDSVLISMSEHYERENKLMAKVKSAISYPIVLMVLCTIVIIALFTFVMPSLFKIFEGSEVPGITKVMMGISDFFVSKWYIVIIVIVALVVFIKNAKKIPGVGMFMAKFKLRVPLFGKFNLMVYTARIARSMSMLYSSGIPLLTTLGVACNVLNNMYISERFKAVADAVLSGDAMSDAIARTDIFDNMFISMIRVGEESGNMEDILRHTADFYDQESEVAMQRMLSTLEPLLLVIMGVIIALVLVSVMVPIFQMYQTVGA